MVAQFLRSICVYLCSSVVSKTSTRLVTDLHQLLAQVLALEQPEKRARHLLEPAGDVEPGLEGAALHPFADAGARFGVAVLVVAHKEAAHGRARDEDLPVKARADVGLAELRG